LLREESGTPIMVLPAVAKAPYLADALFIETLELEW